MSESKVEALEHALKFSDIFYFEQHCKTTFPGSEIWDLVHKNRRILGDVIDYESLKEKEWDTPEKRMGFAILISNETSPFSDSGIKKFAEYCIEIGDREVYERISWILEDIQDAEYL